MRILSVLILALVATAAVADDSAPPAAKPDPMVCESVKATGSRISHTVCRKKSEVDAQRAKSQREMERLKDNSGGSLTKGN